MSISGDHVFRIKICGITSPGDAKLAVDAGADAIGLNFFPESSRFVTESTASECAKAAAGIQRVGVFVNAQLDWVAEMGKLLNLSAFQFHGDEPPEVVAQSNERPVIRARRMDDRGVAPITADLANCASAGRSPEVVLIDAHSPGQYGGTGETVSWSRLADYREWLGNIPLILAGGLTPENVAEAIRTVQPYGVDVASGVESSPGVKDPARVREFIASAEAAFAEQAD